MTQTTLYALDFDGVICDSAIETGITGWKAATQLWSDMPTTLPPKHLVDSFRQVRPVIETGYEAILAMRMLYEGATVTGILTDFADNKQPLMDQAKTTPKALKKLFGETRDAWIATAMDEWIEMNPLFPGIAEKLRRLTEQEPWYVVTTKQERFVVQILSANDIEIPTERIFGLDRNMSKEAVLITLSAAHPESPLYFVEDRLPTLLNVLNNTQLKNVKLLFAPWGYNTDQDKQDAQRPGIETLALTDFLSALD